MGTALDAAAFGSVDGVVGEIMRLHRALPARPAPEEAEAAEALVRAADREERARLDAAARLRRPPAVPDELFGVALEMHRALAAFHCREQKRDAARLLELDALHGLFDDLIQRASQCVPSSSGSSSTRAAPRVAAATTAAASSSSAAASSSAVAADSGAHRYSSMEPNGFSAPRMVTGMGRVSMDDSYVKKAKAAVWDDRVVASSSHMPRGAVSANSVATPVDGGYGEPILPSTALFPNL
jgi:hypothetical protein